MVALRGESSSTQKVIHSILISIKLIGREQ